MNIKSLLTVLGVSVASMAVGQTTTYPAKPNTGVVVIKNATVHVGNGQVLSNTSVRINQSKIEAVGGSVSEAGSNVQVIDAAGKHVYPGLILPWSTLGLQEIGGNAVRGSNDFTEIGDNNFHVRAISAYNSSSRIINTLRSNGILLAHVAPRGGGMASGSSTVVQLDAWNYGDAAYATDNGVVINLPSLLNRRGGGRFAFMMPQAPQRTDAVAEGMNRIEELKRFFRGAKAWHEGAAHRETNLRYDALKGLFNKEQKLYMEASELRQMLVAVDFAKEFGVDVVIVGGTDAYMIPDLLKANNISVILSQMHDLPTLADDDIDQPFKSALALQNAGVLYAINDNDSQNRGRNLPFNAGTAVAFGLTKEQAVQAITLNAAKILGIDKRTGSIEAGKDANIIISEGDILDMRSSRVTDAFIEGRKLVLDDVHKQLFERYKHRYNIQ